MMKKSVFLAVILSVFAQADPVSAQNLFGGAGIGAGRVPRVTPPLCSGAPTAMSGLDLAAKAGVRAGAIEIVGSVDYVTHMGATVVADCVPVHGIVTDSSFSGTGTSATNIAAGVQVPVYKYFRVGGEAGIVPNHSSWFIGAGGGVRRGLIGVDIVARRYATSFDEVTRDYQTGRVVELSRVGHTDISWGWAARVLFMIGK